jgi:MFS family permease
MKKQSLSPSNLSSTLAVISAMYNLMINSVISIYAREYVGATVAEVGLIFAAWSILSMFAKPIVGRYFYGTRLLYAPAAASILLSASAIGMALSPTPLFLALFRVFQGLGNSLLWGPTVTLVALSAPDKDRDRMIGRYTLATSVGLTLGPVIASANVAFLGMRSTFFSAAGMAGISLLLGWALIQQKEKFRDRLGGDGDSNLSLRDIKKTLSMDSFRMAFSAYLVTAFCYGILLAYGTLQARDAFMVSEGQVVLLIFGYNFIVMLGRLLLIRILGRVRKEMILVIGLINGICMLTVMTLSDSYILFFLAFCLLGLSHGIVYPAGTMMIAESTDRNGLSLTNSIYMVGWDIGNTLGPTVSAPIAQSFGTEASFIIAIVGVICVLSSVTLALGRNNKKKVRIKRSSVGREPR